MAGTPISLLSGRIRICLTAAFSSVERRADYRFRGRNWLRLLGQFQWVSWEQGPKATNCAWWRTEKLERKGDPPIERICSAALRSGTSRAGRSQVTQTARSKWPRGLRRLAEVVGGAKAGRGTSKSVRRSSRLTPQLLESAKDSSTRTARKTPGPEPA